MGLQILKMSLNRHLNCPFFWSIFDWIIVFWVYIVKETSYDVLNIVFEKSIFSDQIQIFNAKINKTIQKDVRSESKGRRNRFIELNDDFFGDLSDFRQSS